jgi:hypothetical protein
MVNGLTIAFETARFFIKSAIGLVVLVGGLWFYAQQCNEIELRPAITRPEIDHWTITSTRTSLDDLY